PSNTYAGKTNAGTVRGDERLLSVHSARTTDYLLCQLSTGRVASVRVARLPETTRAARAELARSFISLDPGERPVGLVPVGAFSEEVYLVVFTREGRVKKTPLSDYLRVDEKPSPDLRLLGKRTTLAEYPRIGRATGGVATMQLSPKTLLVGAAVLDVNEDVLLISASGQSARVPPSALPIVARDRKGCLGLKIEGSDTLSR